MADSSSKGITGLYSRLHTYPLCVVFRRQISWQSERYEVFKPVDKIDAVVYVIQVLSKEKPEFSAQLPQVDEKRLKSNHHRTRRYVAEEQDKLYSPDRADFAKKYARKVENLWVATNLNTACMQDVIQEACEAAQIEYGHIGSIKF